VLIGFTRVFVGIHWPIDIAGGVLTGLVGAAITLRAGLLTIASDRARSGNRPNRRPHDAHPAARPPVTGTASDRATVV
jgi:membrane-associated phospholipid phosphatase